MLPALLPDPDMLKTGWKCLCPRCKEASLYAPGFTLDVRKECPNCHLRFDKSDSADGPAVFLVFILGFLLVPIALWVEYAFHWPVWVHAVVWGILALALTIGTLRPLKAYIIALQFKHRDWS
ncbi:MAG: DUF983 domain-containing protein [Alphaproteobacteria bacterium]|nr:DUF983 domain-containing protein [Alphaproteobacteria bacterium]MCD8520129.1 DUF983 domain-containing protein [Alphaproteobacteria bacterium]MCD8525946.1 DUF983 domain-containing protein [Alphaproteobacteria bacterium]MCD8571082.1 DUF983 domain-containing protein [Alphaproteobacteria bacterium]